MPQAAKISLPFKAFPKQLPFVQSSAMFKLGGGARGGGKSHTLAGLAVLLSFMYPGNVGIMGRAQLTDFRKTTLPLVLSMIPSELLIKHEQGRDFYIDILSCDGKTSSRMWYIEMSNPGNVLSGNYGWFFADEAYQIPLETFIALAGTLRGRLPNGQPRPFHGLLASNPSPGWLMDTFPVLDEEQELYEAVREKYGPNFTPFESPYTPGKMIDADYAYFPFRAADNPANGPGYEDRLIREYAKLGPEWVSRMVYGTWDATMEGLVYQLQPSHLWHPQQPGGRLWRPGVPVELAIDPSNGAGVYGALAIQRFRNRVLIIDEFYKLGGTDEDFRPWVEAQPWYNDIEDGIVDNAKPDTVKRLQSWGLAVRSFPKKKNVTDAINAVKAGMAINPIDNQAQLVIDERRCPNLITEFRKRVYRSKSSKNPALRIPEQPVKAWDHLLNALEYWYHAKLPFGDTDANVYPEPLYEARAYLRLAG